MPPEETSERLSESDIAAIVRWVKEGAVWSDHWSFERPVRPDSPEVRDPSWRQNGVDDFVLSRLEREGLTPSAPASRNTLIRRLSLDLTGLPPTWEEVTAFVEDEGPDAYERIVDRLLASPKYGERWARVWLDLARYSDTKGYEKDRVRTIWRYRDWVIGAFNRDMSYDQFTIEQLAGDLLPEATMEQRLATAFHRNTMTNDEGGTDDEEFRVEAVRDRVDTTMQVWMGLTMGCAKCHDHKYDPISTTAYYEFYAFFNQTADADNHADTPLMAAPTPGQSAEIQRLEEKVDAFERILEVLKRTPTLSQDGEKAKGLAALFQPTAARELGAPVREEIERLQAEAEALPIAKIPVLEELPEDKRRTTHTLQRGNFLDPGEELSPCVPSHFHPFAKNEPRNRLGLARWIMADANPLTARVAVNRHWAQLFGKGLVETEEDFGSQGMLPSHPELLDWLAVEFAESGWSLKALCKTIVMSATYRQSSFASESLLEQDPANRLLARGPRFRLAAESIRDNALAVAGLLSDKMYGPSVMPPQPEGIWQTTYNETVWKTSVGEDRYRRGIYAFHKRTSPYPSMLTFDAPTREWCTIRRIPSNTPLQALVTLNDPVYIEAAQAFARRVLTEGGSTDEDRVRFAFRAALARKSRKLSGCMNDGLHSTRTGWVRRRPCAPIPWVRSLMGWNPQKPRRGRSCATSFSIWTKYSRRDNPWNLTTSACFK
jgi:hypothetical protein